MKKNMKNRELKVRINFCEKRLLFMESNFHENAKITNSRKFLPLKCASPPRRQNRQKSSL